MNTIVNNVSESSCQTATSGQQLPYIHKVASQARAYVKRGSCPNPATFSSIGRSCPRSTYSAVLQKRLLQTCPLDTQLSSYCTPRQSPGRRERSRRTAVEELARHVFTRDVLIWCVRSIICEYVSPELEFWSVLVAAALMPYRPSLEEHHLSRPLHMVC